MNRCPKRDITIREAINWGADQIQNPDCKIDAKLLMLDMLKLSEAMLLVEWEKKLNQQQLEVYQEKIALRAKGMPTQYIIGTQEFMGLEFQVNPSVLIPRQDTEVLVEKLLSMLPKQNPIKGIDIGTGTGCIGISLAYFMPNLKMTLIDVSKEALSVAKANVERHHLDNQISLLKSDLLTDYQGEKVDLIVSNPPYITAAEMEDLMIEVKDYEPHLALTDGLDGLSFYKRIARQAKDYLKVDGLLAFEIGYNQAKWVKQILENENYSDIQIYKDLSQHDRVVLARQA